MIHVAYSMTNSLGNGRYSAFITPFC